MPFVPDEIHPAQFHAARPWQSVVHPFFSLESFAKDIFVWNTSYFPAS
jgi:hypothetical protein